MQFFRINVIFILLLFLPALLFSTEESLDKYNQDQIREFINVVKTKNREDIADYLVFPLKRKYPLKDIHNKGEFIRRFDEVFDERLFDIILNSNPSEDWQTIGWSGIALNDGIIWMRPNGLFSAINHDTQKSIKLRSQIIQKDRESLYPKLRDFKELINIVHTKKYKIRIDHFKGSEYRYSVWARDIKMSNKPDLILYEGVLNENGSCGNTYFDFENGSYRYHLYLSCFSLGTLIVYKDEKILFREEIEEFLYPE